MAKEKPRALIIGGSMAGLFSALLLERIGWRVDVFERVDSELAGRGAGIVTHDELFQILERAGVDSTAANVGVWVAGRRVYGLDGALVGEHPLPQILTSWGHLYRLLLSEFSPDAYHRGKRLDRIEETATGVIAHFGDGSAEEGDLLIGADGIFSAVRAQMAPGIDPAYVGYFAWRGLVDEADLTPETRDAICDHFAFSLPDGEQMLGYPVAGVDNGMERGRRRFNFVWYRPAAEGAALKELLTDTDGVTHTLSIPPHKIRPHVIDGMRADAKRVLAPQFAEAVLRTKQPFLQAIQDLETPRMRLGKRTVIVGDAAFVARPHVGMGVTKAAGDAAALADSIAANPGDLDTALAIFEKQRLAFGAAVIARARRLGAYMQAQCLTEEEREAAKRFRSAEAVMTETAVATGIAA